MGVFPDIRWAVSLGQYEIADAYTIERPPLDSEAGDGTPMRFVDPKVLTLIVLVSAACASIAFADVPNELARWMLSKGKATTPLPAPERVPAPPDGLAELDRLIDELAAAPVDAELLASSARWGDEYAWQVATPGEQEVSRLPTVEEEAAELRFAGGAIIAQLPPDWQVSQTDHFRHVRLYITRQPLTDEREFSEGIWISYHVRSRQPDSNQLAHMMQQQLDDAHLSPAAREGARAFVLNGRPALRQPFRLLRQANAGSGYHLLIVATWGVVEVHARYRDDKEAHAIATIVDNLNIGEPHQLPNKSNLLLGSWKAERARLLVGENGTVELQRDREHLRQIENAYLNRPPRTLTGTYSLDGDVMQVTWRDGSQLNLRYQSTASELLLTDHHGRVSQLQRLFE